MEDSALGGFTVTGDGVKTREESDVGVTVQDGDAQRLPARVVGFSGTSPWRGTKCGCEAECRKKRAIRGIKIELPMTVVGHRCEMRRIEGMLIG
jgi:hypothetical protein